MTVSTKANTISMFFTYMNTILKRAYTCTSILHDTSTCYLANHLYPQLVVFVLFLPMVYSIKRTVCVIYMKESVNMNYWQFRDCSKRCNCFYLMILVDLLTIAVWTSFSSSWNKRIIWKRIFISDIKYRDNSIKWYCVNPKEKYYVIVCLFVLGLRPLIIPLVSLDFLVLIRNNVTFNQNPFSTNFINLQKS